MQGIRIEHLVKRFGSTTALADLSLRVGAGECFGLLGPNGAGKTTAINTLCTLLRPTAGQVWVNGLDVAHEPAQIRRSIGLVFQEPTLDFWLTAWQNLALHAAIYGVPGVAWHARGEQLLRMVDLWERRHDLVRTFSGGMRRRLEVVRSLLHEPQVLFLDEPTSGLDPRTRDEIWRHLLVLRQQTGMTLFLTTHHLEEAEHCDRVAILDQGRMVALDTPARLKALAGSDVITLKTPAARQAVKRLQERFGIVATQDGERVCFAMPDGERFVPRLVTSIGVPLEAVQLRRPTLDDAFRALTTGGRPGAASGLVLPVAASAQPVSKPAAQTPGAPLGAAVSGLGGVVALWRRDLWRYIHDRAQIVGSMGQALLVLLVIGGGIPPTAAGGSTDGIDYRLFLYPSAVALTVLASAIASAISIVWDREFGALKEVLVSPVPRWAIGVGKALGGSTTALAPGLVLLAGAPFLGVAFPPLIFAMIVLVLLLIAFCLSTVGLLIAVYMKTMESFQVIVSLVLTPLVLFSGALFPVRDLPGWLGVLAWLNPLTYGIDALRQLVLSQAGAPAGSMAYYSLHFRGQPLGIAVDLLGVAAFAAVLMLLTVAGLRRHE